MKIGNLILSGKVILAPLSGVADTPFRLLAKRFGAGLVYTEMISAEGLMRGNTGSLRLLYFRDEERPIGVQIFGANPESMASACPSIDRLKPDLIDLNFGCPVKKVVQKNGGAALLKDLRLLEKIVSAVTRSSRLPVTVKTRSGWDQNNLVAVQVAKIAENYGASAVTVHPRTQKDGYSNRADWDLIAQVKKEVNIPVIGSGDIFSPEDAKEMLDHTGCDAVMIGRGALGNPWIFSRTNRFLESGELLPEPSSEERMRVCLEHIALSVKEKGEYAGLITMRKHLIWYTKGMPRAKELRQQVFGLETLDQVKDAFQEYVASLKEECQSM
ncbi:MAG: tRNA dihydrouridine synthase DusB [Candidatus Zixiibacteriota bacterium]